MRIRIEGKKVALAGRLPRLVAVLRAFRVFEIVVADDLGSALVGQGLAVLVDAEQQP